MTTRQETKALQKRVWIRSGIVEEMDAKQTRLLEMVLEKIQFYYEQLHGTRPCYRHPLSLFRLKKLCNRSGNTIIRALHYLANSIPQGAEVEPPIYYDRASAVKNKTHRPYRIFLRKKRDSLHT